MKFAMKRPSIPVRRFAAAFLLVPALFLWLPRASGEEVQARDWYLMKMAGDEAGWFFQKTVRYTEYDKEYFRTSLITHLSIKRLGGEVTISTEGWSLENDQGHLVELHQKNHISNQDTLQDLVVMGKEAKLTTTTMGKPHEAILPWEEGVLGTVGTWRLHRAKGFAPDLRYEFRSFVPDFSKIVTVTVRNVGWEETELLDGKKARLFHLVSHTDVMPNVKSDEWYDEEFVLQKTSINMMGTTIDTYRTTEERAKKGGGAEIKTDMIIETMARSNVILPDPYTLDSILYRLEAKDPEVGLPEHLNGFCQKVLKREGNTAEVLITAKVPEVHQERPLADPPPELSEYLEPNAYIQSDHAGLKAKALEVVGDEKDAWKAAVKLEKFVHDYIEDKSMDVGFASAAEVFENPRGDCSEHGVLLAALCRAAGIPARVAVGYMYVGGIFGGHMWAEVWIQGHWYPIDGVMGMNRVDPTHMKFMASSLKQGGLGEAFASAVTAIGNLNIKILAFTRKGRTTRIEKGFKDYRIEGRVYTNTLHGISIQRPEGYEFKGYEHDFSNIDFTLVEIERVEGHGEAKLQALPVTSPNDTDAGAFLEKQFARSEAKVISKVARTLGGVPGVVFMVEREGKTRRAAAVILRNTCYVLAMEMKDEARDLADFEAMAASLRFVEE